MDSPMGDSKVTTPIYLDFNATTPVAKEVAECMTSTLTEFWGNPSSAYETGRRAKAVLEKAREDVAAMINAKPSNIIFTSGGTEANNIAIFGVVPYFEEYSRKPSRRLPPPHNRPHVIVSNVEHDAVLLPAKHLEQDCKIEITLAHATLTGTFDVDDILYEIRPSTCLISIMLANNETGVIFPLEQLAKSLEIVNKKRASENMPKILLHTDAAQAIGKIPVDVESLGVNYLTIVGHKFYGPRGGCLYAQGPVYPMMFGGGQEKKIRPGTENVMVAVGLAQASQLVTKNLEKYAAHYLKMRQLLETKLKEEFGDEIVINFRDPNTEVLPNTCSVSFMQEGLTAAKLLEGCSRLEASMGAACHNTSSDPSVVLLGSGIHFSQAKKTVRLSVGRETTDEDIMAAVADLRQSLNAFKKS